MRDIHSHATVILRERNLAQITGSVLPHAVLIVLSDDADDETVMEAAERTLHGPLPTGAPPPRPARPPSVPGKTPSGAPPAPGR